LFEGEDHESLVDVLAQELDTSLTPRPELRAHVVHDRNTTLFHLTSDAPVERRRIDDDGHVWPMSIRLGNEPVEESPDFRKMAENLCDADDGEVFGINDGAASGSSHLLAANAEE